jgi:hypothetical protein
MRAERGVAPRDALVSHGGARGRVPEAVHHLGERRAALRVPGARERAEGMPGEILATGGGTGRVAAAAQPESQGSGGSWSRGPIGIAPAVGVAR